MGTLIRNQIVVFMALASAVGLLFFQNCSPVKFVDPEQQRLLASTAEGSLVLDNGAEYTNRESVQVSIKMDGAKEMYLTQDPTCGSGGEWVPFTAQTQFTLRSPNTKNAVFAKFRANNINSETSCISDDIIHDNIPPRIAQKNSIPAFSNAPGTMVQIDFNDGTGSGFKNVLCNNMASADCKLEMTYASKVEGSQNIIYTAFDKAGNKSNDVLVNWIYDKTPPAVVFNMKPAAITADTVNEFKFSLSDNISLPANLKAFCQLDTKVEVPCVDLFKTDPLTLDNHAFKIYAVDQAGNKSVPENYLWKIIDGTPKIELVETPKPLTNLPGQFVFRGMDAFGVTLNRFECRLNSTSGTWMPCTSPLIPNALVQGNNIFEVKGIDVRNVSSAVSEYRWMYDSLSPVIAWDKLPPAFTKNATELISIKSVDAQVLKTINFKLNGQVAANNNLPEVALTLVTEGLNTATSDAEDLAGNKSNSLSYQFYLDKTAPMVDYEPITSPTASATVVIKARVTDNIAAPANTLELFYALDANTTYLKSPSLSEITLLNLPEGKHTIKSYAVDKAGNMSEPKVSSEFVIDLQGPVITFIEQPVATVAPMTVSRIRYEVMDNLSGLASVMCRTVVNNVTVANESCAASRFFDYTSTVEGNYTFEIIATDMVGRSSMKSISWKAALAFAEKSLTFSVSSTVNNNVDILFVMDNSQSMQEEQRLVSEAFSGFIQALSGLNYRVGITTTDVASDGDGTKGKLKKLTKSGIYYITPTTASGTQIFQNGLNVGLDGSGDEKGITASRMFLDLSKISTKVEYQFSRPQAIFATIIVSDSNEDSPDGSSTWTAQRFFDSFKLDFPQRKYINHSVIAIPGDTSCLAQSEVYGTYYFELSQLTGGISTSICSSNYGRQLVNFANRIVNTVSEQTLDCPPADVNKDGLPDVTVSFIPQGSTTPTTITGFTINQRTLSFTTPLSADGQYLVKYYCPTP